MSLVPGTRLGPYEVVAALGAGGMGEVYRARDISLDRAVALKLLPEAYGADPNRLIRFQREAKTLATLNHPHIAQIHGLEIAGGLRAIVMELVEGEDLADRLARGPMPLDEALPVARQIAEALEAAHDAGIVHRDLKPANIKLRADGTVKVLDFGLAKLVTVDGVDAAGSVAANSPTITSPAMTQAGVLLGTAAYMAPEQAKGRAVDRRADIWAYGCVVYEMLTGRRLFAGTDVAETLAAVLRAEPDWGGLPGETPDSIRRLLARCLARDPLRRLPHVGVARLEIDDALNSPPSMRAAAPRSRASWTAAAALALAGVALGALAVIWWPRAGRPPAVEPRVLQVAAGDDIASPILSPDGRSVAFVRRGRWLAVQSLDTGAVRELQTTDGASDPFWSPDSSHLAYFAAGEFGAELRAVPAVGGPSRVIVRNSLQGPNRRIPFPNLGAAWCDAGIVYVEFASRDVRLVGNDGQDRLFAAQDAIAPRLRGFAYPHCLGDGRLLGVLRSPGTSSIVVVSPTTASVLLTLPVSNTTAVRWPVMAGAADIVFERSEPNAGLWTVPVTASLSATAGPERLVLENATRPTTAKGMIVALSGLKVRDRELVWVDREGRKLGTFGRPQREFLSPSLSRDATQVIATGRRLDADDIWVHRQDSVIRWGDTGGGFNPAWSPDAHRVAYVNRVRTEIVVRSAAAAEPRVVATGVDLAAPAWTPDGASIVYASARDNAIWIVPASGGQSRRLLENAREPAVSPTGGLIAYASVVSGRSEVYVTTFPAPGEVTHVSTDGGIHPRWTAKGELLFGCGPALGGDPISARDLCLAVIDARTGARRGVAAKLFDVLSRDLRLTSFGQRGYDVAADGRILIQTYKTEGTPTITLIEQVEAWLQRR